MRKFEIQIMNGERFFIHENGSIERADMPGQFIHQHGRTEGSQWLLRGICQINRGLYSPRLVVAFENLESWVKSGPQMLFKNGKPRFTVADLDHGTYRVWGNTDYRGIRSISCIERQVPDTCPECGGEETHHPHCSIVHDFEGVN